MIIVVEPYYTVGHGEFVAGFLDVIQKAHPEEAIEFWSEQMYGERVKEHLVRNDRFSNLIQLTAVDIPGQLSGVKAWINELQTRQVVDRAYKYAEKMKATAMYFTSATLFTHCQAKRLALKTGIQTYLVLHQDLQAIEWKTKPWQKSHYFRFAMEKKCENFRYIVLGKSIRRIAQELRLPHIESMIAIDMPCFYPEKDGGGITEGPLHFGTVGIFKKERGAAQLFKRLVEWKSEWKTANFSVRGYIIDIDETKTIEAFQEKHNLEFLPREEYENWVKALDYILFFYPLSAYRLMASASVFEAIIFEKPILALRNPYFEDLFERFGPFGKLFETEEALFDEVFRMIANPDAGEKQRYLDQMKDIRRRLDTAEIAKDLAAEIEGQNER